MTLVIRDTVGVILARRQARRLARALGFSKIAVEQIVLCTSELGNNLWQHAQGGRLCLIPLRQPRVGLQLLAEDNGPGIEDVGHAVQDGVSSAGGLGSGLSAVRRLMDEVSIHSQPGQGTRVEAIKWKS